MSPSSLQEVTVLLPVVMFLLTTGATIVVHSLALAAIAHFVLREQQLGRAGVRFWRDLAILASATLLALLAHLVEITIWAVLLESCGEFTRLAAPSYHSAMNYATWAMAM
jgi:hypothetical protein